MVGLFQAWSLKFKLVSIIINVKLKRDILGVIEGPFVGGGRGGGGSIYIHIYRYSTTIN